MMTEKRIMMFPKVALCLFLLMLCADATEAQEADYYRMEVGAGLGVQNYLGDYNRNLFRGFQPMGEVVAKYLPNERMAIAADLSIGALKGNAKNAGDPYISTHDFTDFKTTIGDLSLMFEYNFWRHGMAGDYRHLKPLVPYVAAGIGASYINAKDNVTGQKTNDFSFNIPLGIGVKYKIAERVNSGLEWTIHFTSSDKLDGVADPLGIKSSGLFKNTDCFTQIKIYVTYSFMAKCRQCNN